MSSTTPLLIFLLLPGKLLAQAQQEDSLKTYQLNDIVVTASRLEEDLSKSPVSIEKVSARTFYQSASPSFFDALENVKGIQMLVPSLGFKVINTRGFGNTTNVRFVQMVDGMDNQAPHLGTPIANMLGPSDLDIKSVEVIPGTAAALYGMNAINGLANFITKDPFSTSGVSAQQKAGFNRINPEEARLFSETSLRWAHAINDKLAFKINGTFVTGSDWVADDRNDLNPNANLSTGLAGPDNPAFDPLNSYGNESPNRRTLSLNGKDYVVARTGYYEKEVVDYGIRNLKADAAIHYLIPGKGTFIYTYRFANLDNIYQRANRFRLDDYMLQQHGVAYKSKAFTALAYLNTENTGKSYNARSMAENIDRHYKSDDVWFSEYTSGFNSAISMGMPVPEAHRYARQITDAGRPVPGSVKFNTLIETLADINNWDAGAALRVKAKMLHAESQFNLSEKVLKALKTNTGIDLLVGLDHRTYFITPDGNYFINPKSEGAHLTFSKTGGFIQVAKAFRQKLKLSATLRADKNEYFKIRLNLRVTAVYSIANGSHFRFSFQRGFRFPSIFEAFSNVNSGGVKRVGGLRVMSTGIFENAYKRKSIDEFQAAVIADVNKSGLTSDEAIIRNQGLLVRNDYSYVQPERIRSFEVGYRGAFFNEDLQMDFDLYFNRYNDFIAQVEMNIPKTLLQDSVPFYMNDRRKQDRYRLWTNSKTTAYNFGAGIGIRYNMPGNYQVAGNATFAKLQRTSQNDGLEDGFNTPEWIFNLSFGNEDVLNHFGFNLTCRWQSSYFWESFLVNGIVPAYYTLDGQISKTFKAVSLKIGGSNILNQPYYSFLGGPSVGGFYYTSVAYNLR